MIYQVFISGVRNFADFPFADRTFADRHLLIRHLLTGPGHLLTQTFADFSHPCHLLTLEGRLLIQTIADSIRLVVLTFLRKVMKTQGEKTKT